jgi:Protein of unknown function (DUF2877)
VVGIQRRACHLVVDGGPLLILSGPDVALAPNGLSVDVAPHVGLRDVGFHLGERVWLGPGAPADDVADWLVIVDSALTWEPRPSVHRVEPRDLRDRLRAARAAVVADGAAESLLPLLWASESEADGLRPALVRTAGTPARLLSDAAFRRDEASVTQAARGLAGLGPGLTPSGDDLLTGFVAAWTLVGEALGRDRAGCERVTAAVVAGGERGVSPLGCAWLEHACRGELLEPMTGFVASLLSPTPWDLVATARGALAVGSSSGTDWMVGFLLAAETMLDATTAGPPW